MSETLPTAGPDEEPDENLDAESGAEPGDEAGGVEGSEAVLVPRPAGGGRGDDRPKVKVFLEGRYRKLTRDLPQTVFFCPECKGHPRRRRGCARCEGFGKLTKDSVQELIGYVVGPAFKTRKHKFHGAGREDLDVRMLGQGRPFVVEVIDPKVLDVDLAAVEAEVNRRNAGRLEIRGLHWADKGRVRVLKEEPHAKEYEALVALDGVLDRARCQALVGRRLHVVQQTPARVAHRRADKARERWIEFLAFEPLSPGGSAPDGAAHPSGSAPDGAAHPSGSAPDGAAHPSGSAPDGAAHPSGSAPDGAALEDGALLRVRLRTEHGTYVKEAIHGEGGATRPSLSELLGVGCACRELDVIDILDVGGTQVEIPRKPLEFGANLERGA